MMKDNFVYNKKIRTPLISPKSYYLAVESLSINFEMCKFYFRFLSFSIQEKCRAGGMHRVEKEFNKVNRSFMTTAPSFQTQTFHFESFFLQIAQKYRPTVKHLRNRCYHKIHCENRPSTPHTPKRHVRDLGRFKLF